jgi:hypothetical protein
MTTLVSSFNCTSSATPISSYCISIITSMVNSVAISSYFCTSIWVSQGSTSTGPSMFYCTIRSSAISVGYIAIITAIVAHINSISSYFPTDIYSVSISLGALIAVFDCSISISSVSSYSISIVSSMIYFSSVSSNLCSYSSR